VGPDVDPDRTKTIDKTAKFEFTVWDTIDCHTIKNYTH
jgi:hypothetical protein